MCMSFPHKSVTAVIHIPLLSLLACGLEPGGICLCASKTRCTQGQSRFVLKKKSVSMRSARAAFLPCHCLRASPSAPWTLCSFLWPRMARCSVIPSHGSLLCFDCSQLFFLVCLLLAYFLASMSWGFGASSGRKALWAFVPSLRLMACY